MPRKPNVEPSKKKQPHNSEIKEKEEDEKDEKEKDFSWYEKGIEKCLEIIDNTKTEIPELDNMFVELERRNDAVGALLASMYSKARTLVEFVDVEGGVRLLRQGYTSLQENITRLHKAREDELVKTTEMAEYIHFDIPVHTSST